MTMPFSALLQVAEPLGAIVVQPADDAACANGWRLPWRTLGHQEYTHLQDLLRPLRVPLVSNLFRWTSAGESAPGMWPDKSTTFSFLLSILSTTLRFSKRKRLQLLLERWKEPLPMQKHRR